jgi:hypothetical protein
MNNNNNNNNNMAKVQNLCSGQQYLSVQALLLGYWAKPCRQTQRSILAPLVAYMDNTD